MSWPWSRKKEAAPVATVVATAPQATQEAIAKLKEAEKMLNRQSKSLEKNIQQQLKIARENARTNKTASILALKRKRRFMKQLKLTDGQLTNLEVQIDSLQNSIVNKEVLDAIGVGAQALKATNEAVNPDYVHDVMDELTEQNDIAREVAEIMGTAVGFTDNDDDDELEDELEELVKIMKKSKPQLPSVPTEEPVAARPEGAKDLRKELAELAL